MSINPKTIVEPRHRQTGIDEVNCDSETDSSEILSVGNEPLPTATEGGISVVDESARSPSSLRSPRSPSSGQVSPESLMGSADMTACSPGRAEYGQDASLPGYPLSIVQQQLLKCPQLRESEFEYTTGILHGLANEMVCPCVERFHKSPMNVMSLLQVANCRGHPTQQLQRTVNNSRSHLQLVPDSTLHQSRLSANKILLSESPESPSSREESHLLINSVCNGLQSIVNTPNNRSNIHNNTNSNNNNNNGNNNNSTQHQASLKFSIDNILKADFGRRITDPISFKKSRPKKVMARPVDLSKDFLESSSEGSERNSEKSSERSSETSTRNVSPSLSARSPTSNTIPSSGTDSSKLMQWPAWVYCTRYSDRPSSGKGHIICTGNWYTSVDLIEKLLDAQTYLLGTLRKNHRGNPQVVVNKKLKRGHVCARQNNNNVTVLKWKDKRDVLMLSTLHSAEMTTAVKRNRSKEIPKMARDYNLGKSSVELSDQMIA